MRVSRFLFLIAWYNILCIHITSGKKGSNSRGSVNRNTHAGKAQSQDGSKSKGSWFSFYRKKVLPDIGDSNGRKIQSSARWTTFTQKAGLTHVRGHGRVPYYFLPISWGVAWNQPLHFEKDKNICVSEVKYSPEKFTVETNAEAIALSAQNYTRLFFLCDGRCCGLDCCEFNVSFLVIFVLILVIILVCCCCYGCFIIEKTEDYWTTYLQSCRSWTRNKKHRKSEKKSSATERNRKKPRLKAESKSTTQLTVTYMKEQVEIRNVDSNSHSPTQDSQKSSEQENKDINISSVFPL